MYIYIAIFAYIVVLFLTLRDIRIFKRTHYISYRKGAMKGIISSFVIILGAILTLIYVDFGLLIVFIGLFINKKGPREVVFKNATVVERFLGKTDL